MRKLWVLWIGVFLHYIWGLLLIFEGDASTSSTVHVITNWFGGSILTGIIFIAVGFMAMTALLINGRMKRWSLALTMPQQAFLLLHAGLALYSCHNEITATGSTYPWDLLLMVHAPLILLAIFHNIAILHHHWGRNHEC